MLLSPVRVTGWSGTVVGWFDQPRPIPLFDDAELHVIAGPSPMRSNSPHRHNVSFFIYQIPGRPMVTRPVVHCFLTSFLTSGRH